MAQGQASAVDAPDTLPADFFDKKKQGGEAPDTLPGDFFEKKTPPAAKPTLSKTETNLPGGTEFLQKAVKTAGAQPETQFEKQNKSGFFGKAAEVARRATQGAGFPQSTTPGPDFWQGALHMIKHPVDSAKLLGSSVSDAMGERFQKSRAAGEAMTADPTFLGKAMKGLSSAAYAVEGSVPVVGPAIGQMADSGEKAIKEKDPWEAAGTAAEALGMGATAGLAKNPPEVGGPSFLTKAVRSARGTELSPAAATKVRPEGAFQPALANVPQEVLQHAKQEGINLTPFQASETKLAGKLQVAGEHGLVGGHTLDAAMKGERAKFGEAVNKLSERVDPTRSGLSEEAAGEAIKQGAETAKSVAHENATNGYKKIDYFMQEKVDPAPITKKWLDVRESLPMGVEEQIKAQVPRNLRAVVEDMLSAKPDGFQPTVEQAIKLRSFFREMGEAEGLPNSHQAAFRQLEGAADSAIESTGKKVGAVDDWREANAGWKDYTGKYGDKQSPLYKILKQADPGKITRDLMTRGSASDIEILRKEGMTSALEPLRRQVIQDIARNKFTVGRDGLGGYSDSFLHQLFGPGGKKELYLKADLARRMNWEPNPSGTGGVNLAGEQLTKPSKVAGLTVAAKASMPRDAMSFLPSTAQPTRYNIGPGLITPAVMHDIRRRMEER